MEKKRIGRGGRRNWTRCYIHITSHSDWQWLTLFGSRWKPHDCPLSSGTIVSTPVHMCVCVCVWGKEIENNPQKDEASFLSWLTFWEHEDADGPLWAAQLVHVPCHVACAWQQGRGKGEKGEKEGWEWCWQCGDEAASQHSSLGDCLE